MLSFSVLLVIVALVVVMHGCCFIGFNWEYRRGRRLARKHQAERYQNLLDRDGMEGSRARLNAPTGSNAGR